MGIFQYKLIDHDGRPRHGVTELPFENELSALTYLERRGGTVIYVRLLPALIGGLAGGAARFFGGQVKRSELAEALSNLSVMLGAGIAILPALRDTFASSPNPALARVGSDIIMRVESGSTLSEAVSYHKAVFPTAMVFLMRLGEESGTLDQTIKDAAEHLRRVDRIARDTRNALIYPAFVFASIFAAITFWLWFVVPTMVDLFRQLDVELPKLTQWVIATADWLAAYAKPLFLTLLATVFAGVVAVKRSVAARRIYHGALLKMPIAKTVLTAFNLAFISEYFALLLGSGIDVMRSLDIMRQTVDNEVYREKLGLARGTLIQGVPIHDAFAEARMYPPFVLRMVGVGEETGTLTEQLDYIASEYRDRLARTVATMGKTIEPIAILVGGGLFLLMAVGLFMPIYGLVQGTLV